jgi:hypothetical protein
VWLVDYSTMHKNKDFLDWVKENHSKILLLFVSTNYINALQPIDVILQKPLKHAFKKTCNYWITNVIKQQFDDDENLAMNFKTSNLNPYICEWLHQSWIKMKAMQIMIVT